MKKEKYDVGQEIYLVRGWNFTKAKIVMVMHVRDAETYQIKYKAIDVTGQEHVLLESEMDELPSTFKEAKALALQNLDATTKNLRSQVEATTKKAFEEKIKQLKKEQKKKKKAKKK